MNYPPGTWEGDPRAPWNQPDEEEEFDELELDEEEPEPEEEECC